MGNASVAVGLTKEEYADIVEFSLFCLFMILRTLQKFLFVVVVVNSGIYLNVLVICLILCFMLLIDY